MSKKAVVPDAWDEDWEVQADKADVEAESAKVVEQIRITKAERLANHAETNKKIWNSAETPEAYHFLAARDNVPLKQEFKPALKVLSRKPTPKAITKIDPLTGVAKLTLDEDEDDEEPPPNQPTQEEIRQRTIREREEKQRKYDAARARILGTGSGTSTPGSSTPPAEKGKGRGTRENRNENRRSESQQGSKAAPKELFDPNYTPKPGGVTIQRRNGDLSHSGRSTPKSEDQIAREPRGPDGSAGFGFGNKTGKMS